MLQFGGKLNKSSSSDSKRHFAVIMGGKENGRYISSTPSSAAKKAVTKLCASNKSKKVEFHIREITQGSKKKTYGPYIGYIEKLKEPIELKGRIIKYKPVAKLIRNSGSKKGGAPKSPKDPKDPNTRNNTSIYYVPSNSNNNTENPAAGPAPVGIYNYVPNNSRYSAASPEPSATRFVDRNNNLRNHLEGLAGPAPVFDDFNNFNNPAAGPARAGPAQQNFNDFNNFNNPAAGPAPIISAPVSRRIPKYAFVNYTDLRYKEERNAHRTNPNYIAYKQKIKNYATSKKDLGEINSDYWSKKIEEFLKKNYDSVKNSDVKKAYQAMKTFKRADLRKEYKKHPLLMERLQKFGDYNKAKKNLDKNKSESKTKKVEETKKEWERAWNAWQKFNEAEKKKSSSIFYPKKSQKFFVNIPELPNVKGEKRKTFQKMKYPISFREINTKEELIALMYWLEFIDYHKRYTNSGGYNTNGERQSSQKDNRDKIENSLRKIFKHIKDIEINQAYRYVFSTHNNADVNLQEIKNLVEETKKKYPNWVKYLNENDGIYIF
jgi:hypothetical protein